MCRMRHLIIQGKEVSFWSWFWPYRPWWPGRPYSFLWSFLSNHLRPTGLPVFHSHLCASDAAPYLEPLQPLIQCPDKWVVTPASPQKRTQHPLTSLCESSCQTLLFSQLPSLSRSRMSHIGEPTQSEITHVWEDAMMSHGQSDWAA